MHGPLFTAQLYFWFDTLTHSLLCTFTTRYFIKDRNSFSLFISSARTRENKGGAAADSANVEFSFDMIIDHHAEKENASASLCDEILSFSNSLFI